MPFSQCFKPLVLFLLIFRNIPLYPAPDPYRTTFSATGEVPLIPNCGTRQHVSSVAGLHVGHGWTWLLLSCQSSLTASRVQAGLWRGRWGSLSGYCCAWNMAEGTRSWPSFPPPSRVTWQAKHRWGWVEWVGRDCHDSATDRSRGLRSKVKWLFAAIS